MVQKRFWGCWLGNGIFHQYSKGGSSSLNEYYHISTRLHLLQIMLLPSRGLNEHQRQLWDFAFLSRATQPLELPLLIKSPVPHIAITMCHCLMGTVKRDTWSFLCSIWLTILSPTLHLYIPPHDARLPLVGKGRGCESEGKEAELEITALCASVTAWQSALHKILFTAHAVEKLQQQSSTEAGKISWPGNT